MLRFIVSLLLVQFISAQTEKNNAIAAMVLKTLRVTARHCMETVNATEADLENLRKDPPFPEKAACIITCLLEKVGIVKDKQFSKSGFMITVNPLIFYSKKKVDHMKMISENCDNEIKPNEDFCQLGNDITGCIFKYAPELHFKS